MQFIDHRSLIGGHRSSRQTGGMREVRAGDWLAQGGILQGFALLLLMWLAAACPAAWRICSMTSRRPCPGKIRRTGAAGVQQRVHWPVPLASAHTAHGVAVDHAPRLHPPLPDPRRRRGSRGNSHGFRLLVGYEISELTYLWPRTDSRM